MIGVEYEHLLYKSRRYILKLELTHTQSKHAILHWLLRVKHVLPKYKIRLSTQLG